jgi:hypothetical protein
MLICQAKSLERKKIFGGTVNTIQSGDNPLNRFYMTRVV